MARRLRARHDGHPDVVRRLSARLRERPEGGDHSPGHARRFRQPEHGAGLRHCVRAEHDDLFGADLQFVAEYSGGRSAALATVHRVRSSGIGRHRPHAISAFAVPGSRLEFPVRGGVRVEGRRGDSAAPTGVVGPAAPGTAVAEEAHQELFLEDFVLPDAPPGTDGGHEPVVRWTSGGHYDGLQGQSAGAGAAAVGAAEPRDQGDQRTAGEESRLDPVLHVLPADLPGQRLARTEEHVGGDGRGE